MSFPAGVLVGMETNKAPAQPSHLIQRYGDQVLWLGPAEGKSSLKDAWEKYGVSKRHGVAPCFITLLIPLHPARCEGAFSPAQAAH